MNLENLWNVLFLRLNKNIKNILWSENEKKLGKSAIYFHLYASIICFYFYRKHFSRSFGTIAQAILANFQTKIFSLVRFKWPYLVNHSEFKWTSDDSNEVQDTCCDSSLYIEFKCIFFRFRNHSVPNETLSCKGEVGPEMIEQNASTPPCLFFF